MQPGRGHEEVPLVWIDRARDLPGGCRDRLDVPPPISKRRQQTASQPLSNRYLHAAEPTHRQRPGQYDTTQYPAEPGPQARRLRRAPRAPRAPRAGAR